MRLSPIVWVAMLCVSISGCRNYAEHTRRSICPRCYDGALSDADGAPALRADIEALGARKDYNSSTNDILECLGSYAAGLRWKRNVGVSEIDERSKGYLNHVGVWVPSEEAWEGGIKGCVANCGQFVRGEGLLEAPLSQDRELALKYVGLCQAELPLAAEAVRRRADRKELSSISSDIDAAQKFATDGSFISFVVFLEQAEKRAGMLSPSDRLKPILARAQDLRQRHAEQLARVASYRADPRVNQLERQQASLETSAELVRQQIAEVDRVLSTIIEQSARDPLEHRRTLLGQKQRQILADQQDIERATLTVRAEYGLR